MSESNKHKKWSNKEALAHWTSPPLKYGHPIMTAGWAVGSIMEIKETVVDGKPYDPTWLFFFIFSIVTMIIIGKKIDKFKALVAEEEAKHK